MSDLNPDHIIDEGVAFKIARAIREGGAHAAA